MPEKLKTMGTQHADNHSSSVLHTEIFSKLPIASIATDEIYRHLGYPREVTPAPRMVEHIAKVVSEAQNFDPRLRTGELRRMGSGTPEPGVKAFQDRILAARGLAFLFPVWWFGPPAILKGFVDRVFQENFAFRFLPGGLVEGLLNHPKALVLNTTGTGALLYRTFCFDKPLHKTFCEWTLRFCGVKEVRQVLLHNAVEADDATRRGYLEQAGTLGREFFG